MDGAEQRRTGRGECDEVPLAGGPGRCLLRRLGGPGGQRRAGHGVGEFGQARGLCGPGTEQTTDERAVEGVDGGQGLVESVDRVGEQSGAHHATALACGNHCISGNGAVVGSSSR